MIHGWLAIAIVLVAGVSSAEEQIEGARLPVPGAAALAEAKKTVTEIYKADHEAAKTLEARQALARKLLNDGKQTANDPASKYMLLEVARSVAASAGAIELAYTAAETSAQYFQIEVVVLKAQALAGAAEGIRAPADHYFFGRYADRLWPQLRRTAAWPEAATIADLAETSARKNRDADLAKMWTDRRKEVTQLKQLHEASIPALATLAKLPADPQSNEIVGKVHCFVLESWTTGVPMLALAKDAALQGAAEAELRMPTTAADKLSLANRWFDIAKTQEPIAQRAIFRHAYVLYRDVLPTLTGLAKAKTQARADECFTQGMPSRVTLGTLEPVLVQVPYAEKMGIRFSAKSSGRDFPDSLWAHPPSDGDSRIVYEIPAGCQYLSGQCGFNDMDDTPHFPVNFIVKSGGVELWRTPDLRETKKLIPFKVPLKGQKQLELIVHCHGFAGASHAIWFDPMLHK